MKFNPEDYETVQERIGRFYEKYEHGRILTELVNITDSTVVFKASIYLSDKDVVKSTGYAMEEKGQGFVNKFSHIENCETSAIGRALANMNIHGNKRASLEEMNKVNKMEFLEKIEKCKTLDELSIIGEEISKINFTEKHREELKKAYSNKKNKLEAS